MTNRQIKINALKDLHEQFGAFFTKAELEVRGGDIEQISTDLMHHLHAERLFHGFPTLLTSVHRPGDPRTHGAGEAADKILFHTGEYMRRPVAPTVLWNIITTWPWWGSGLYLDWRFQSRNDGEWKRTPGAHTDVSRSGSRPLQWFATTFLGNTDEPASIAQILDKEIETRRRFFYRSHIDGKFYERDTGTVYTITDALALWDRGVQNDEQKHRI